MRQIKVGSELESVKGSKSCSALSSCAYRKESRRLTYPPSFQERNAVNGKSYFFFTIS